jgi:hypothetical protein
MEHARLVAELARSTDEVNHLRARVDSIERNPMYPLFRMVKSAADRLRGRR